MKKQELFEINDQGELMNPALLEDICQKYKPDSLFLKGCAPYIIMIICAAIDGCFFYSLFSMISYDRPLLLWVQIAGFLFGFDFLPIYAGVVYKKLQQGLTKDRLMLWLSLGVCALICTANIGLRAVTVDVMSPDLSGSDQGYFGQAADETAETEFSPGPAAWMVAITGMVVPMVTSVGSFVISNTCYDPLLNQKQREEIMICKKADKIRRLNALIQACEGDADMEQRMLQEDARSYGAARNMTVGLLLEYHDVIRQRLMAHLQEPAATSMLSVPSDREELLNALNQLCIQNHMDMAMQLPAQGSCE